MPRYGVWDNWGMEMRNCHELTSSEVSLQGAFKSALQNREQKSLSAEEMLKSPVSG